VTLAEIYEGLRDRTRSAFITTLVESAPEGKAVEVLLQAELEFDNLWANRGARGSIVRGTQVIDALNTLLEQQGYRVLSSYNLARAIRPQTIPIEIFDIILRVEEKIS
jgi:hypothetical protein